MHLKLLILLAILGPFVDASTHRFTDYTDQTDGPASPDAAARDPAAWMRSDPATDFAARARRRGGGGPLLPGLASSRGSADPFASTWNQYMNDVLRSMLPAAPWFGTDEDDGDDDAAATTHRGDTTKRAWRLPPGVHARETDAERLYFMDVPGFHRAEVAVEVVAGHVLSVKAQRKCDPSDAYCTSRTIHHTLELDPDTIDTRKISVNLDAGELRIHLPKRSATRFTIPVLDSLFGLNQPGASDKAGDKVHVKKVAGASETTGAEIQWPGAAPAAGVVESVTEWAKDKAGGVVESAESLAARAKQAALGSTAGDAAEYGRRAVHHTTDLARDAVLDASHQAAGAMDRARDSAARVAQGARDGMVGTAQQARDSAQQARDAAYYKAQQARDSVNDKAKHAAEGVYGAYDSAAQGWTQAADQAAQAAAHAQQAAADAAERARRAAMDSAGQVYEAAAHTLGRVQQGAHHVAGQAQETARGAAEQAVHVAKDSASAVQAKAGQAVDAAKDSAASVKHAVEANVIEPVEHAAEAAKHRAGDVVDATKHKAGSWFGFFQDVSAGAKEAAKEGTEGAKEGWEKGQQESYIKRHAGL